MALAAVLRHIYLKEPLTFCLEDCELATISPATDEQRAVNKAIDVAVKLLGTIEISADCLESQNQLMQHVGQVLLQQADSSACGMPASLLAWTLLALIEKVVETIAAAAGGNRDVLYEQAELLTAAFKRISAGKAFTHCPTHPDKACCRSAQMHFTMAFYFLAVESYTLQTSLWQNGEPVRSLHMFTRCTYDIRVNCPECWLFAASHNTFFVAHPP